MVREEIKKITEKAVKDLYGKEVAVSVGRSAESVFGDYSTNVAMILKKNPQEIADAIKSTILEKIEVKNGFINFFISKEYLQNQISEILKQGVKILQKARAKKETIVIEYSSPNIAKPLGIHHLGSTIIGQALVNILRFVGYKVISLSFPGDWGTQFGLLIAAFKKWGDREKLKKNPIAEMLDLYVRFSQAAKENPKLLEEGRNEFKKLEEGDKENKKIWQWFLDESLNDFNRVYKMLDIKIENTIGESFYEPELKSLIQDALKKGLAEKGEGGAIVVKLPNSETPEIIQKTDGATIFTTRELAAIRHRIKKWSASKILYVAANQQTFHFQQVFGCAEKLGIAQKDQLFHVKFGMMLASGGKKFATREGRIIPLEDVLKEAIERARKIVEKLNPSLSENEKEEIAKTVGVGAIKFFDLSRNRLSDIIFDWDQMLNLKGFSAPYIQYTCARLNSILQKAKFKKQKNTNITITNNLERKIIVKIFSFDEVLEDVSQNYFPNQLAEYLYDLANIMNSFYEKVPVLKAEAKERNSRLNIVFTAKETLKTGLNLLGIQAPEKM